MPVNRVFCGISWRRSLQWSETISSSRNFAPYIFRRPNKCDKMKQLKRVNSWRWFMRSPDVIQHTHTVHRFITLNLLLLTRHPTQRSVFTSSVFFLKQNNSHSLRIDIESIARWKIQIYCSVRCRFCGGSGALHPGFFDTHFEIKNSLKFWHLNCTIRSRFTLSIVPFSLFSPHSSSFNWWSAGPQWFWLFWFQQLLWPHPSKTIDKWYMNSELLWVVAACAAFSRKPARETKQSTLNNCKQRILWSALVCLNMRTRECGMRGAEKKMCAACSSRLQFLFTHIVLSSFQILGK